MGGEIEHGATELQQSAVQTEFTDFRKLLFSGDYTYKMEYIKKHSEIMTSLSDTGWDLINSGKGVGSDIGLYKEIFEEYSLNIVAYDDGNEYGRQKWYVDLETTSLYTEEEKEEIRSFVQHYDGKSNSFSILIFWVKGGNIFLFEIEDSSRKRGNWILVSN